MSDVDSLDLGRVDWDDLQKIAELCGIKYSFRTRGEIKYYKRVTLIGKLNTWGTATEVRKEYIEELRQKAMFSTLEGAERFRYWCIARRENDTGKPDAPKPEKVVELTEAQLDALINRTVKRTQSEFKGELIDEVRDLTTFTAGEVAARKANETANDVLAGKRKLEIIVRRGKVKTAKSPRVVLPPEFDVMLQLAAQRINILMVGPTQCGKTFMAVKLAEVLDLPFASVSCTQGTSEADIAGRLLPGKGGEFVYTPTPFVKVFTEGGLMLYDELDRADPNVLCYMNAALANDFMHIPYKPDPVIHRHEDFVAVAAANTYGKGGDMQYTAANALDAATLERFKIGTMMADLSPALRVHAGNAGTVVVNNVWTRDEAQGLVDRIAAGFGAREGAVA